MPVPKATLCKKSTYPTDDRVELAPTTQTDPNLESQYSTQNKPACANATTLFSSWFKSITTQNTSPYEAQTTASAQTTSTPTTPSTEHNTN